MTRRASWNPWLILFAFAALCGTAGMEVSRAPLEASLQEEERMAAWIDANVARVTLEYVRHEQRAA